MVCYAIRTVGKCTMFIHREYFQEDSYRVTYTTKRVTKSASGDSPLEALQALIYSFGFDDNGNTVTGGIPRDVSRMLVTYREVR